MANADAKRERPFGDEKAVQVSGNSLRKKVLENVFWTVDADVAAMMIYDCTEMRALLSSSSDRRVVGATIPMVSSSLGTAMTIAVVGSCGSGMK